MNDERLQELQNQVDAILFAAGDKIEITEIARLCNLGHNLDLVESLVKTLQEKYNSHPTLMLVREGNALKLRIREKYISIVKNIATKTELTKSVMETLAIVAYKVPVLQSEIIQIRTNKAYDHLAELESAGYISRVKKGRSKLIRLTDKFFDYFDIPPDQLKERFKNIAELEQVVSEKEKEVDKIKEEKKLEQEIKKKEEQVYKQEIRQQHHQLSGDISEKEENFHVDIYNVPLSSEVVDELEPFEGTGIEVVKEKLGDLEVVDEEPTEEELKEKYEEKDKNKEKKEEKDNLVPLILQENESLTDLPSEANDKFDLLKQNETNTAEEDHFEDDVTNQPVLPDQEELEQESEEKENNNKTSFSGKGLFTEKSTPDFERKVDKRVDEIINPHEDNTKDEKESDTKNSDT